MFDMIYYQSMNDQNDLKYLYPLEKGTQNIKILVRVVFTSIRESF